MDAADSEALLISAEGTGLAVSAEPSSTAKKNRASNSLFEPLLQLQPSAVILRPLLSPLQRAVHTLFIVLLLFAWFCFWSWWMRLRDRHWVHLTAIDWILTAGVAWETFESLYRMLLLLRAKEPLPPPAAPLSPCLRYAMVVTKVPSEPLPMLQATLRAMLAQDVGFPYDVWLGDEDPGSDTRAWCAENGVRVWTRKGDAKYNNVEWPRRRRCKEGNLSYFYDLYGGDYDVVCQFDADHVPAADYLRSIVPIFEGDPTVGYVACPSLCDANHEVSWAVRGRLYLEAWMHGPLGASKSYGAMPCCIGSHYVVRTSALREIGGIGPELDEDYSTSFMMTAFGWKGVFALNTIAHGDGPVCFEDAMRQEYQWSRSAMVLLTRYTTRYFLMPRMSLLERLSVLLFFWYWFWQAALVPATAFVVLAPAWGVVRGDTFKWGHWAGLLLLPYLIMGVHFYWARWCGWLRPTNAPLLSLPAVLHRIAAPFWILQGVVHGLLGGLFNVQFNIHVTPKGEGDQRLLGPRCLSPLLTLFAIGCGTLILRGKADSSGSVIMLELHVVVLYLCCLAIALLHYAENHARWRAWCCRRGVAVPLAAQAETSEAVAFAPVPSPRLPWANAAQLLVLLGGSGGLLGVALARSVFNVHAMY